MNDSCDYVYTYETSYVTEQALARVYRCRSHDDCGHRIKIQTVTELEVPTQFHLEQTGSHGAQTASRRGIHPQLLEEVDALLNMV